MLENKEKLFLYINIVILSLITLFEIVLLLSAKHIRILPIDRDTFIFILFIEHIFLFGALRPANICLSCRIVFAQQSWRGLCHQRCINHDKNPIRLKQLLDPFFYSIMLLSFYLSFLFLSVVASQFAVTEIVSNNFALSNLIIAGRGRRLNPTFA